MAQLPKVPVSFIRYIEARELAQGNSSLGQDVIQIGSQILVPALSRVLYSCVLGEGTAQPSVSLRGMVKHVLTETPSPRGQ